MFFFSSFTIKWHGFLCRLELHVPKRRSIRQLKVGLWSRDYKWPFLLKPSANSAESTMLSEKAKGKQKAVDLLSETPASQSVSSGQARDLVIRFTEGYQDLVVVVDEQDSVRDVKRKVSLHSDLHLLFSVLLKVLYLARFVEEDQSLKTDDYGWYILAVC